MVLGYLITSSAIICSISIVICAVAQNVIVWLLNGGLRRTNNIFWMPWHLNDTTQRNQILLIQLNKYLNLCMS